MGTSISQHSPRSSNWKRVIVCHENEKIPESRVINEIWRAAENESTPISSLLKSDSIFECYEAVRSSDNFQQAMQEFNKYVSETKSNSIVAEFAKRVIPIAFQSNNPSDQWANSFFSEITKYVVSRDASGFVGQNYRNKTVNELIEFKKRLSDTVNTIVGSQKKDFKSKTDWQSFVDDSIEKLKATR